MSNKVFVVIEDFYNNEEWPEDQRNYTRIRGVASTREKAEEIANELYDKLIMDNTYETDKPWEIPKIDRDENGKIVWVTLSGSGVDHGSYTYDIAEYELDKVDLDEES